jgi:hypothetical protein
MYSPIITQIMDDVEYTIRIKVRKHVAYHNFMEVYTLRYIDQLLDCEFHIREQFVEDAENES